MENNLADSQYRRALGEIAHRMIRLSPGADV